MNTKLTHIIEDLRQVYFRNQFENPDPYQKVFNEYDKYNNPEEDEEDHYK
ncbi:hypothetical protein MUP95_09675 [bacterium]|nr:hypothetical protein [bacterium]